VWENFPAGNLEGVPGTTGVLVRGKREGGGKKMPRGGNQQPPPSAQICGPV